MRVRVQIKVYDEEGRRVVVEDLQMADGVSSKDAVDWVNAIRLRAETPPLWGANVIAYDDSRSDYDEKAKF